VIGRTDSAEVQTLIRGVLSACRRTWLVAAVFSLGINLLMLTVPVYMLQLFDRVLMSRSFETLLVLSLMSGIALLALALLDIVRGFLFARLGAWVEQKLGGYVLASHIATSRHSVGRSAYRACEHRLGRCLAAESPGGPGTRTEGLRRREPEPHYFPTRRVQGYCATRGRL
jgi:ABC-type protease/lipase transport system fused ATPase/permease subunit